MSNRSLQDSVQTLDIEDEIVWSDDPNKAYFASVIERNILNRMAQGKRDDDSLIGNSTREEIMGGTTKDDIEARWMHMESSRGINSALDSSSVLGKVDRTRATHAEPIPVVPTTQISAKQKEKSLYFVPEFIFLQRGGVAGCQAPPSVIDPRYIQARLRQRRRIRLILFFIFILFVGTIVAVFITVTRTAQQANSAASALGSTYTSAPSSYVDMKQAPMYTLRTSGPSNHGQVKPKSKRAAPPSKLSATSAPVPTSPPSSSGQAKKGHTSNSPKPTAGTVTTQPSVQAAVTSIPVSVASQAPGNPPSYMPAMHPSIDPSLQTRPPSMQPSREPSGLPSHQETTALPSQLVSSNPPTLPLTTHPTLQPSGTPTFFPHLTTVTHDPTTSLTQFPTAMTRTTSPSSTTISIMPFELTRNFILRSSPESERALSDFSSPQFQAMLWLESDPYFINEPSTKSLFRWVLVTIFYSTSGPLWNNAENWLTDADECFWFTSSQGNHSCNGDGILASLDLDNNNLQGTLPSELSIFADNIVRISLTNNTLVGSLPSEIAHITNLVSLQLVGNLFTGQVPTELGNMDQLALVELDDNLLTGTLPTELANLSNLQELSVTINDLTGTVPEALCRLSLSRLEMDCINMTCSCCTNCVSNTTIYTEGSFTYWHHYWTYFGHPPDDNSTI